MTEHENVTALAARVLQETHSKDLQHSNRNIRAVLGTRQASIATALNGQNDDETTQLTQQP